MANKPLRGINFPGLEDTYIVPEPDTSLSMSGSPADAKATGDAIAELNTKIGSSSQKSQVQIITWEAND